MSHSTQRNPFLALCKYASKNNWCWSLYCTTCGHQNFKISFSKIVNGLHPDEKEFWTDKDGFNSEDGYKYSDFFKGASLSQQEKLAKIVAKSKISDIQNVAKFPDWLGYIGLALKHCDSGMIIYSKKIISDSFFPQLIFLLKSKNMDSEAKYFQKKYSDGEILSIGDLEKIESYLI